MSHSKLLKKHDLEEHQVNVLLHENDAPLVDISKNGIGVYILTGIGLFLVFVIFSVTVTIPQEIYLDFVLKGGSAEQVKRVGQTTFIGKVLTESGAKVEKDIPLLTITSPKVSSSINEVNEIKRLLTFHLTTKTSFHKQEIDINERKRAHYQKQIDQLNDEMRSVNETRLKEMGALNNQLGLLRKDLERQKMLFGQNVISQSQLELSQLAYQQQDQSLNATERSYVIAIQTLKQQIRFAETNQQETKASIDLLNQEHYFGEEKLRKELFSKQQQLALNYGHSKIEGDHLILLAEHSGTVNMISEPETKVNAGEIVWRIEQQTTGKYAFAESNSAKVGQLENGQKVVLKYESYPSFYYGAMYGTIENIGNSPNEKGNYLVRIAIENNNFKHGVRKGMTGRAAVIIEELTLIQILFKLLANKTEII